MAKKVVSHPSTDRLRKAAWSRYLVAREAHDRACDFMWTGMLLSFTDAELALIASSLSIRSYCDLKLHGRNVSGKAWKWHQKEAGR